MKKVMVSLLLCAFLNTLHATSGAGTGDLQYIQNNGQFIQQVLYATPVYGGELFLEKDCFTWAFSNQSELSDFKHKGNTEDLVNFVVKRHAFKTHFTGANPAVAVYGENGFSNYYNYFQGNDPTNWHGKVPAFGTVHYAGLYPGIDMLVYSRSDEMKYDLVVAPHADAHLIQFNYEGLSNIRTKEGNLELVTSINTIVELQPMAYQMINGIKQVVSCNFSLNENSVTFSFPNDYDHNYQLIIDPATLIFASYSGSTSDNWGYSATYDAEGNLYGAGIAFAEGYPVTLGAFQENWEPGAGIYVADVTISKFSPDGTSLVYSTYLGGSSEDLAYSLIVNSDDELVVYGATGSNNFPVTAGCYDASFNGGLAVTVDYVLTFNSGSDAFVAKFSADGSSLVGATYIGGNGNDALNIGATGYNYGDHARGEINLDPSGNIYIASSTRSTNLPTAPSVFQPASGGDQDGFVARFNPALTALNWCSYIGGSGTDGAYSIKKMNGSKLLICGGTNSSNLTTTPGALHTTFQGGTADGYVMTIPTDASDIINATYIGTDNYDQTFLSDFDDVNSVYITGQTLGLYPVVGPVYENSGSSQYITKLDSTLSTIQFSTVFGNGINKVNISPTAFLVDNCHHIYVAGWGGAVNIGFNLATGNVADMPITADAFQSITDGSDFYLVVFDENATDLIYATYFGGPISDEHVDGGTSRFDKSGVVYEAVCAGCGGSDDFPTTEGVVSNTNNATNCNLGVFKFALTVPPTTANFIADPISGCSPLDVDFTNTSVNAASYSWDFGDGGSSITENPSHTYTDPGTYTISLIAYVSSDCGFNDTTEATVTVFGYPTADFSSAPNPATVFGPANFTDLSIDAVSWFWDFGDGFTSTDQNPTHLFADVGAYEVCLTVTNENGCTDKVCDSINVAEQSILEVPNAFSPNGDGVNDVFIPLNYGLDQYEFRIYNRWGQLIFITNNPTEGWDGYFNGKQQELDVYVYVVTGNGVDNVAYRKQGNFTLVR